MDDPPKPPEVRISWSVLDRLALILDIALGVFLGLMLFAYVAAKAGWQWPSWIVFSQLELVVDSYQNKRG